MCRKLPIWPNLLKKSLLENFSFCAVSNHLNAGSVRDSRFGFMYFKYCRELHIFLVFKGAPEGLRQFVATESPLKMMKNVFYFILKAFCSQDIKVFVLTFWSYIKTV